MLWFWFFKCPNSLTHSSLLSAMQAMPPQDNLRIIGFPGLEKFESGTNRMNCYRLKPALSQILSHDMACTWHTEGPTTRGLRLLIDIFLV